MAQPTSSEQGFRLLMQTFQERLYWHIRRLVGSHADADDVLQNTFIKAWRGIANFEGKSKLYTWLYRIATNESLTFLAQKQRRGTNSLDDPGSLMAARLRADQYFDGDEIQLRLQVAIAQLPDKQRLVFNMKYFDELKYEEISAITGTSVGALKASYHHAVIKIETFINDSL